MKKKRISLYFIMIMLFCQITPDVFATDGTDLSFEQKYNIITSCDSIHDALKNVQKADSYERSYLGNRYDNLLNNFITPFNVRLIGNNYETNDAESQAKLSSTRQQFSADYISYQQALEELVNNSNCETDPEDFYDRLTIVRAKRAAVKQNALKMQTIASEHLLFVKNMELEND